MTEEFIAKNIISALSLIVIIKVNNQSNLEILIFRAVHKMKKMYFFKLAY